MAKPRVFISSTFYDLKQIRADLDAFIENLGFDPIRNEEGDIPYGNLELLEAYCYKEIKSVDIVVSIIGGRYGTDSKKHNSSISQLELKTALKESKQVYIFIEKNILSEYETFLLNKENNKMKYRYVDDIRIYQFVEEVKSLNINNNIKGFETASDISKYLKEQFAGLFQRFLEEQTRVKEVNLIRNLEKTAQTLNKLVNYLSDENKGQAEEINKILMINHPLIESLKTKLNIPYNFYIEGYDDMGQHLEALGFSVVIQEVKEHEYDFVWVGEMKNRNISIHISSNIFDDEKRLKYIKRTDWDEKNVEVKILSEKSSTWDDLPF